MHQIARDVPKGVGRGGGFEISKKELFEILEKGAEWAVENGFGDPEDLEYIGKEGNLDVYFDKKIGKKVYLGRGKL